MDSKLGHFSLCSFECFLIIRSSDIDTMLYISPTLTYSTLRYMIEKRENALQNSLENLRHDLVHNSIIEWAIIMGQIKYSFNAQCSFRAFNPVSSTVNSSVGMRYARHEIIEL